VSLATCCLHQGPHVLGRQVWCAVAQPACCLHLSLLYVLGMLHVWLAHPWMDVLDLVHCHHVCWGWAVHVKHDWTLKRHALHCNGITTMN
jgi:hypothetical protein